jgi:hypothetical protein
MTTTREALKRANCGALTMLTRDNDFLLAAQHCALKVWKPLG